MFPRDDTCILCTFCLYSNFKLFQNIQLGLVQNTSALCKIQQQSITSSASAVVCQVISNLGCESISQEELVWGVQDNTVASDIGKHFLIALEKCFPSLCTQ